MTAPIPTTATTWRAVLCGIVLFASVDGVVFRTGLYARIAKPESNAGWFVRRTVLEPELRPATPPGLVVLGDSTMAEGCIPELLRTELGVPPPFVRLAAIPGTTPRVWPFLLDAVPAPPGGWRLTVVGLATYDDDAPGEALADRALDLAFLGPTLTLREAAGVAADFTSAAARRDVWLQAACKSYAWRRDVRDLLASPSERREVVRRHLWWLHRDEPYAGVATSLAGARVEGRAIVGLRPEDATAVARLRALVWPGDPIDNGAYRRKWLGRLRDRVVATGSELVLLRVPTQMLPRAVPRPVNTTVVDELARSPHVHVLDAALFAELERPEFTFDAVHLNRAGAERFTRILAGELRRRFGALLQR